MNEWINEWMISTIGGVATAATAIGVVDATKIKFELWKKKQTGTREDWKKPEIVVCDVAYFVVEIFEQLIIK